MSEPSSRIRTADRDYDIWQRYTAGETQAEIGAHYGIDQATVSRVLARMRDDVPIEERRARQRRQLADLDHMRENALAIADAAPIPAYSQGKAILMADGTQAEDHTGRVRAMDAVVKFQERESRALGLDAKPQVEHGGSVRYEIVGIDPKDLI